MKKLGLVLILFLLRSSASHAAEALAKFPFVYGNISGNTVPVWIAKEQGFFRKYDLDPQLIFIIAGRAAQAMLSGEIKIGIIGVAPEPTLSHTHAAASGAPGPAGR